MCWAWSKTTGHHPTHGLGHFRWRPVPASKRCLEEGLAQRCIQGGSYGQAGSIEVIFEILRRSLLEGFVLAEDFPQQLWAHAVKPQAPGIRCTLAVHHRCSELGSLRLQRAQCLVAVLQSEANLFGVLDQRGLRVRVVAAFGPLCFVLPHRPAPNMPPVTVDVSAGTLARISLNHQLHIDGVGRTVWSVIRHRGDAVVANI
mmetsp:Transcript_128559/g.181366  ORF Transcript_128559/g.181366 Transcript_128559/m.181366 type:complete len:201 (-) Transcript_128559:54-656(-)